MTFIFQVYNQYCEVVDNHDTTAASASKDECNSDDLHLEPGHPRLYHFSFLPSKEDVGGQIEVTSIFFSKLWLKTPCLFLNVTFVANIHVKTLRSWVSAMFAHIPPNIYMHICKFLHCGVQQLSQTNINNRRGKEQK